MNIYIAIFPNTHPDISGSISMGAGTILSETKEDALNQVVLSVPQNWPILIYEKQYYDKTFHTAYEPDWSEADGFGINENMRTAYLSMGFLENW